MKKTILAASLVSLVTFTMPAWGEQAHHPAGQASLVQEQVTTEQMSSEIRQMAEMRHKIESAGDPATRRELMHRHMQMMQDGMQMMSMMGGQGTMQGGGTGMMGAQEMMQGGGSGLMKQQDMSKMPMADRMGRVENRMAMMERKMAGGKSGKMESKKMMRGGHMMGSSGMMAMMHDKMTMMEEIMKGLMIQQEMMMKKLSDTR